MNFDFNRETIKNLVTNIKIIKCKKDVLPHSQLLKGQPTITDGELENKGHSNFESYIKLMSRQILVKDQWSGEKTVEVKKWSQFRTIFYTFGSWP